MKIIESSCCGDFTQYQLNGWDKDDSMCADDFLKELMDNEYKVTPKRITDMLKK